MQRESSFARRVAAQEVYAYLAVRDQLPPRADCVIGFGHFDPAIACRSCAFYAEGRAGIIAFTGGTGAGSADLDCAEALFFREVARQHFPSLPDSSFVLETASTNTGENVRMLARVLTERTPPLRPGRELRTAILVASPYRQRRVWLTCRLHWQTVGLFNAPPVSTLQAQENLFRAKGQDFFELLAGEVDRLVRYGREGFIVQQDVPEAVLNACRVLRE